MTVSTVKMFNQLGVQKAAAPQELSKVLTENTDSLDAPRLTPKNIGNKLKEMLNPTPSNQYSPNK